jgi:hypothetical protein
MENVIQILIELYNTNENQINLMHSISISEEFTLEERNQLKEDWNKYKRLIQDNQEYIINEMNKFITNYDRESLFYSQSSVKLVEKIIREYNNNKDSYLFLPYENIYTKKSKINESKELKYERVVDPNIFQYIDDDD